jgi:hypothetical protein
MQDYESYYRLFKTSWGILIGFAGNIRKDLGNKETNLIKINDFLYLKLNIPNQNKFIHDNRYLLENGILWVANILPDKTHVIIEINKIDLNFCNFQIEGLFFGMSNWLCSYYNIDIPNYYSKYDKNTNSYLFWFDVDDEKSVKLLYPDGSDMSSQ